MVVFIVVAGLVLIAIAIALVAADGWLDREPLDAADPGLPADRELTADDLAGLRFRVGVRGYRMDDVDTALDRLADSLAAAEAELAIARTQLAAYGFADPAAPPSVPAGEASTGGLPRAEGGTASQPSRAPDPGPEPGPSRDGSGPPDPAAASPIREQPGAPSTRVIRTAPARRRPAARPDEATPADGPAAS